MALTLTLNIFSGRQNPVWILSDAQEAEFNERVAAAPQTSNLKAIPGTPILGYRGFSVRRESDARSSHIYSGIVDSGPDSASLLFGDRELESFLLSTARDAVADEVADHVKQAISTPPRTALFNETLQPTVGCPACNAVDAPAYNPASWNIPTVQPYNNCYNYANNKITNTFAQPGRATGHPITVLSCAGVTPSAQSDGLVVTADFSGPLAAGQGWYVALVIWPNQDYHWYRQDNVGCWSHKPGQTPVTNKDSAGNAINDPRTCDRGPYTDFCTFMITKTTVHIS